MEPTKGLEGFTLRPLIEDPRAAWSHAAYTQVQRGPFPGYSVRTERWRYTNGMTVPRGRELYDHDADPKELQNLANDPQAAGALAELQALVKANWPARITAGKAEPGFREKLLNEKSGNPE
ncbi:MAG: hypothetical protein WDN28_20450 [Chthoniobacter sp.]